MNQQRYFGCSSRHAFGPAANPLNNFSPLHLLTPTERLSDPYSRISQATHFRQPAKTQRFNMLKSLPAEKRAGETSHVITRARLFCLRQEW